MVALNDAERLHAQIGWYDSLTFMKKASKVWDIDWENAISNVSFVQNPFKPRNKTFTDLVAISMANFDTEENSKDCVCGDRWKLPDLSNLLYLSSSKEDKHGMCLRQPYHQILSSDSKIRQYKAFIDVGLEEFKGGGKVGEKHGNSTLIEMVNSALRRGKKKLENYDDRTSKK
ncbi:unnamed protein product [Onchocerca flexuosa]|uniref:RNA-directed DNA polymerase, eukaryota, reverse transcriptase zinc-binding domain protein n=1 Tax=Onchocerca flexuosa TaxID=387005 RepID=A0A183H2F9_9BILA|nr:unnamed protein product [Onchocerca flexuosa]